MINGKLTLGEWEEKHKRDMVNAKLSVALKCAGKRVDEIYALLNVCGDYCNHIRNSIPVIRELTDNLREQIHSAQEAKELAFGEGLAALAANFGGEGLRRYCEYLNANSYEGNALEDAAAFTDSAAREQWAADAYRKFVTDNHAFLDALKAETVSKKATEK